MNDCLAVGQLHAANICGFCGHINDDIEENNNVLFCNLISAVVDVDDPACNKYYDKKEVV